MVVFFFFGTNGSLFFNCSFNNLYCTKSHCAIYFKTSKSLLENLSLKKLF